MKLSTFFLLVLTFTINSLNAQKEINLLGNLSFGQYEVGVKQLSLVDSLKEAPREISIRLWYPAIGNGDKLKFSNYLDYRDELSELELLRDISIGISGEEKLFSKDSLELLLNAQMHGIKDGIVASSKFPLLVWSIRYGTVEYQNLLSEYLASHGYIVAFAEDEPNSPYPWELISISNKVSALNQQISDINASIEYLKHQPNVDQSKIGLLSWSYGGESAILAQMDNADIDLVVGLSSLGFTYGIHLGQELNTKIDFEKIDVPYLFLMEKVAPNGNKRKPPDQFDSMHLFSRYVLFNELAHGNFNAIEGMIPGILRTSKVQSWSKGGEIAQLGYETICKVTLSFLDTIFDEANIVSFDEHISNIKENLPEGFIEITLPKKK